MNNNKSQQTLFKMVFTALFAALCYVALFFMIPIPSPVGKPFLHLGNMFVILAALLFSGPVGGIAGSLGMGLFDLTQGYAAHAPATFILKLGIGLITGFIASKASKTGAKSPVKWIYLSSLVFISAGAVMMFLSFNDVNQIYIGESSAKISPVIYDVIAVLIGAALLAAAVFTKKLSIKLQYAVIGAVCGILFNLLGEFLFGALTAILAGSAVKPALIASAISLPATIINGTFSIAGAVALYIPLENAFKKSGVKLK